jgi:hypothetical protein
MSLDGPCGIISLTDDGTTVVSADDTTRTLAVWSAERRSLIEAIDVESTPLAMSARGNVIWLGCDDGTTRRYERR